MDWFQESVDRQMGRATLPVDRMKNDDGNVLADEEWVAQFFGGDEDTDIAISMGTNGGELYEKMGLEVRITAKLARSLVRDDVRKIAEFLRSFDDDQRLC